MRSLPIYEAGGTCESCLTTLIEPAQKADSRLDDGVLAAVIKYPLECAEAPVGGFTHH
ncbi:hypothetical protein FOFC_07978 [Fusarium oxysporum]|nr:hypothetical protein FOFC_07978 [Fusarium oxysporum]